MAERFKARARTATAAEKPALWKTMTSIFRRTTNIRRARPGRSRSWSSNDKEWWDPGRPPNPQRSARARPGDRPSLARGENVRPNKIKQMWRDGQCVTLGWLSVSHGFTAEVMARQGFDALCVDLQHGTTDMNDVVADAAGHLADRHGAGGAGAVERSGHHHEGARPRRLRHHRAAGQHRRGSGQGGGGVPLSARWHALVRAGARRALRRRRLRGPGQRRDRRHGDDRDERGARQPRRDLRHAGPRRRLHRAGRPVVRARPGPARRQPGPGAPGHLRQDPRRGAQARHQGRACTARARPSPRAR